MSPQLITILFKKCVNLSNVFDETTIKTHQYRPLKISKKLMALTVKKNTKEGIRKNFDRHTNINYISTNVVIFQMFPME